MNLIEKDQLYPLLFEPVYRQVMWGGHRLSSKLHRPIPPEVGPIGEAWDISDRAGVESLVLNGALRGVSLRTLVETYSHSLVGSDFAGGRFPVLVKILDAEKRLSLQVHPSHELCEELQDGSESKCEMWYVMDSEPSAQVMAGLKPTATRHQFIEKINSPDIEELLQTFDSMPGDAYYIPVGCVHAICGGNLILEIQQNSDTSFRISDWNRKDENGNVRELHLEKAIRAIDFLNRGVPRISGASNFSNHNRKYALLNRCPHFQVDELKLVDTWIDSTQNGRSFHILTAINGPIRIDTPRHGNVNVEVGGSVLIPAILGSYQIRCTEGQTTSVIRTTL